VLQDERVRMGSGRTVLVLSVATALLLCLAITHQSLWIDEAFTTAFTAPSSVRHLIEAILREKSSEAQMPLYNIYIWAWAKLFGISEYALRTSNIPFAVMLTAALGWTSYHVFRRPFLWAAFCLSPFVVFYMNEARPYVAVMGCAAVSTGALLAYFADRPRYASVAPWFCVLALVLGCGIHMLAAFLAPVLMIYAVLTIRDQKLDSKSVLRDWSKPLLVSLPLLLVLGAYYAWTILTGIGGTRGSPGLGNIAFAAWEFAGFAGLGPPRNQLRVAPSVRTLIPYWPWLAIGVLACVAAVGIVIARLRDRRGQQPNWNLLLSVLAGMAMLVALAVVARFEFWGRHLSVFFPGLVFAAIQITSDGSVRGWLRSLGPVALLLLMVAWGVSDARLLSQPQYYKDDYRSAAAFALDEARRTGGTVVWAADPVGGRYYGIDLGSPELDVDWPVKGKGVFGSDWTDGQIEEYLASHAGTGEVILVLSKPDVYDKKGAWGRAVRHSHAPRIGSANSFEIYAFK
jgi:hypothetical protein